MSGATSHNLWQERQAQERANARLAEVRAVPVYRAAPPMQQALRKALAPILKEAGPATGTLQGRWAEIVGERLAKVSEPLRVQPGKGGATLFIRAPSAAAPMIQHASDHIMERVTLASGSKIRTIRIVQTAAPPQPKKAATVRPLTADERAGLTQGVSGIKASGVREALERLGEAVLTWKS